ncbi:unnamed protein product [Closterium sp. NIES-53]
MVMTFSAYHYNNAFSSGDAAKSCMDMRGQVMNGTRMLSYPQFKIVDIARSSLARPDAHQGQFTGNDRPDCSHWCVPGVPDSWSDIVYSYMAGVLR